MDKLALFEQSLRQCQVLKLIDYTFLNDLRLASCKWRMDDGLFVLLVDERYRVVQDRKLVLLILRVVCPRLHVHLALLLQAYCIIVARIWCYFARRTFHLSLSARDGPGCLGGIYLVRLRLGL